MPTPRNPMIETANTMTDKVADEQLSLTITKWRTKVSVGTCGMTGLLSVVTGLTTAVLRVLSTPVIAALIGGGSLMFSATAIAVALYFRDDLEARACARTPHDTIPAQILLALAAFPKTIAVATKWHPELRPVTGVRHDFDEGLQLHVSDEDWIPVSNVDRWSSSNWSGA